ncbi:MAG: hypothetical protein AB3X44_08030 [Leptothrix sp. (in: b-proteobacteria)]
MEFTPQADIGSAYDLTWLTPEQRDVLMCLLKYLSEELAEDTVAAQRSLRRLRREKGQQD